MQAQQIQIAAGVAHLVMQRRRWRRAQRRRMLWVRPWLEAARHFKHGHFHRLMLFEKANVQLRQTSFLFCLFAYKPPVQRQNAVEARCERHRNAVHTQRAPRKRSENVGQAP